MRKFLTILNIFLLFTLVLLTLYVFDLIEFPFLKGDTEIIEELPEEELTEPEKIARKKTYEELMNKGDFYYESGIYSLSIDAYTSASEQEPNKIEPLLRIGEIQLIEYEYEKAKNLALEVLKVSPTNVSGKIILGRSNIGLEDFAEAKTIFENINVVDGEVLYYQGMMAAYFGEYEKARGLLNRSLENPISETVTTNTQKLIDAMNEFDKYQAGLHEHLKVLLARALVQVDQPHMAKELVWNVLKDRRDYRDAWIILGYSYLKLERYQDSVDALEEAVRQDPEKPETFFYLGLAYAGVDQMDKAIESLEFAAKFGYEPKIHVEQKLAELYFQNADYEKASDKYEEVISKNATEIDYFIRPVWVYIDKLDSPDKAVNLAEKALVYHPENPMSYNLLGWAQVANNDFINGNKNLQKALTFDPSFDAPYLNLGWMYEKQNQLGRAKDLYKKAYELSNGSAVGNLAAERYNELLVNIFN